MGMHPPFPLGSATVTLLSFPDCCSIVHRILFISCSPLSAIGYNVNTVLSLEMTRNVFFKFPFFAIPVYNTDSYSHFRAIYMRFTILLESRISMVIFMYMYSLISENRG